LRLQKNPCQNSIGRLLARQFINKAELSAAKEEDVTGESLGPKITVEAEYIAEKIRAEIINTFGLKAYEEGMNVYTTIDSAMQDNAVQALRENLYKYDQKYGWRDEQVFKDFNFSILRSAYQKEGLFIISSQLDYKTTKEENLNKLQMLHDHLFLAYYQQDFEAY
jgi:membrane carboxypeptidase/penicillin-binding protein